VISPQVNGYVTQVNAQEKFRRGWKAGQILRKRSDDRIYKARVAQSIIQRIPAAWSEGICAEC